VKADSIKTVLHSRTLLLGWTAMLAASQLSATQKPADSTSEPHRMIMTQAGFLALDPPKGWTQSDGPGLAFFLPDGVKARDAQAWMVISAAPVGPKADDKDADAFIQSDIAGFKHAYPKGIVKPDASIDLPVAKQKARVYAFESGEKRNVFELVAYIEDSQKVWTITLSANSAEALAQSKPALVAFAASYRGSIQMGSPE
jgi:hypothetical protein